MMLAFGLDVDGLSALPTQIELAGHFPVGSVLYLTEQAYSAVVRGSLRVKMAGIKDETLVSSSSPTTVQLRQTTGYVQMNLPQSGASISFQEKCKGNFFITCYRTSSVEIGRGTTANKLIVYADRSTVKVGNDCLISDPVTLQAADQHAIVDLNTGAIINDRPRSIIVGNHVWLARNVMILADSVIGEGAIISAGSTAKGDFEPKCIYRGRDKIKSNVTWSRHADQLDQYCKELLEQESERTNG